jgi:RHS repeat-associated protein
LSATRTYDAFGNATASSGTWRGPFGYGGGYGYQEDGTGLRLLGHRFYDPGIGRFLTRDPVKDGRNWYVYCANDPVNGADPTGLILPILAVGAVAIGIAGLIRLGHDAGEIIEDARQDKVDPTRDVWGDDEALLDRWENQVPGYIERTRKLAEDQYIDQYVYGPIGEAGGDGAKVGLEAFKKLQESGIFR